MGILPGVLALTACSGAGSRATPAPTVTPKGVRLVVRYQHKTLTQGLHRVGLCQLPKGSRISASSDSNRIVVRAALSESAEAAFRDCVKRLGGTVAP